MKDRKLVINLTDASETMLFWLMSMFDTETNEARGAAANEHLWSVGSKDDESRIQHMQYCDENLRYASIVAKAAEDIYALLGPNVTRNSDNMPCSATLRSYQEFKNPKTRR